MYTIYFNNGTDAGTDAGWGMDEYSLLYYQGDDEYALISPILTLTVGEAGNFQCEIPSTNPAFNSIIPRRTMIRIKKDEKELFRGEVRSCVKSSSCTKGVYAVGTLAFLYDSMQMQNDCSDYSVQRFMNELEVEHAKQVGCERKDFTLFKISESIDKKYDFYTNFDNTLDVIREKVIEETDAMLKVEYIENIDYLGVHISLLTLEEYGKVCAQTIRFGENLLDYTEDIDSENIATACLPLGKKLDAKKFNLLETYTDVSSVNNSSLIVKSPDAIKNYGYICKRVDFEDVSVPKNLLAKAKEWLKSTQFLDVNIELTAIDLFDLQLAEDEFEIGDRVRVVAEPFGMDSLFPIQKIIYNLDSPDENRYYLGATKKKSYTDMVKQTEQKILNKYNDISTSLSNKTVSTSFIVANASEEYKVKDSVSKFSADASSIVKGTDVCTYIQNNSKKVGFIVGGNYNVSDVILGDDKKSVDVLSSVAVLYKHCQEMNAKIEKLEGN